MQLRPKLLITTICVTIFVLFANAAKVKDKIINYYGISNSLEFNQITYELAWSAHPTAAYYKQEYVPKGEKVDVFQHMLLMDFIQADIPVLEVVRAQMSKLEERKKTDAVCHYELIHNADKSEYILDFLMSESINDHITTVEWNAYHYKEYTDKTGHKGVLLLGISRRGYLMQVAPFLQLLKGYRTEQIKALADFPMPEVQIQ